MESFCLAHRNNNNNNNNLICLSITVSRSTTCYNSHLFHYGFSKDVFISLKLHTSDNQYSIWTTSRQMFWTTNRRSFEVTLNQIRGICFMNEHRKHATCCQKPVAAGWPRMETSGHAYRVVVRWCLYGCRSMMPIGLSFDVTINDNNVF